MAVHAGADRLQAGLEEILRSPASDGIVELIVRRPAEDEREVLEEGFLDVDEGLIGDAWLVRGSSSTEDGSAHPGRQLTLMNSRVIGLIADERQRWPLAGDQLYVDLDLRPENLPAGTRLAVGSAVIEVTDQPHTGCAKFTERFGPAAIRFVNSPSGRALRLRGMYARVVEPGTVRPGDSIRKAELAGARPESASADSARAKTPCLTGARPESASADSDRAKIPEGVRFAAAALVFHIRRYRLARDHPLVAEVAAVGEDHRRARR